MSAPWGPREPYDPKSDGHDPDGPWSARDLIWLALGVAPVLLIMWLMG